MEKFRNKLLTLCFLVFSIFGVTPLTLGKELRQKWVFLNPEGTVKIEPIKMNFHPLTLEGKTVMLRWNGKHNGDKFLERVGAFSKCFLGKS